MKKNALTLLFASVMALVSGGLYGSSIHWGTGTLPDDTSIATVYLIAVDSTVTIDDVTTYLYNYGTSTSGLSETASYTLFDTATEESAAAGYVEQTGENTSVSVGTYNFICVIVEGTKVAVVPSIITQTTVDESDPSSGTVQDALFEIPSDIVWYSTTGALVPEPTCLALLALGVAGLALRRKVA